MVVHGNLLHPLSSLWPICLILCSTNIACLFAQATPFLNNCGTCSSCKQYCHTHSSQCFDKEFLNDALVKRNLTNINIWNVPASKGAEGVASGAVCINCESNTEGERCERCRPGFFKLSNDIRDGCRKCACGDGHGNLCNPFNGESCNCQNNTETDRQCSLMSTKEFELRAATNNKTYGSFLQSGHGMTGYSLPCWTMQCSKCKDYFSGVPTNGHQCYRQMYIDKEYCFDPVAQENCLSKPGPLPPGRTVFFAIQPRFLNVDIKLVLNVLQGEVDMYLASRDNLFTIHTNQSNGIHHAFLDKAFVQRQFLNASGSVNSSTEVESGAHTIWWLSLDEGKLSNYGHTLEPPYYLREKPVATGTPQYHSVESLYEIALFRKVRHRLEVNIPYLRHELKTSRFFLVLRGNTRTFDTQEIENLGYILFRQDQLRVDLFVFFSVFFSSFFLFLCFSVLGWKVKQMMDFRRAQQMHEIELEHMASRPFACITLFLLDHHNESVEPPLGFRKVAGRSVSTQSTPAKKMSIFRHLTLGFKDPPKVYPENTVHLTTKLNGKPTESGKVRPVSVEPTSDGTAAILTTLVQLPGGTFGPMAAASGLVSLRLSPLLMQQPNSSK